MHLFNYRWNLIVILQKLKVKSLLSVEALLKTVVGTLSGLKQLILLQA